MSSPNREATQSLTSGPAPAASPVWSLAVVAVAISMTEFFVVWGIEEAIEAPYPYEALLHAIAQLAVALPLLYLLFVRPTARNVQSLMRAEAALRAGRDELERRVEKRTAELEAANRLLLQEVEHRRHAQQEIQFQASLLDAVEQAVAATSPDGRVLYWNRSAESLFGWTAEEAKDRKLTEMAPFVAKDPHACAVFIDCAEGQGWTGEIELARRNGSRFSAHLTCSPILDSGGKLAGYVYLAIDLSDRKAAEEALRYSESKYSTLVENSPTGIFIYRDGHFAFANQKLTELLGFSREELAEMEPHDLIHPEDRQRAWEITRKRLAGEGGPLEYAYRFVVRDGSTRWVSARNAVISYRGGPSILGNLQDITERKQAEEALRHSKEELRQHSARLLEAQEAERKRIAWELHDSIGQSLSAIKFVVENALAGGPSGERRSQVLNLRSVIPMLQDAVEEVRSISTALRPSILDDLGLVATITWFSREFQAAHPELQAERQLEVKEEAVPEALKTVIYRIIQEASHNVAKHSRAKRLLVCLRKTGSVLELVVEDDGQGFDPERVPRELSDRGLGLSSMKERAELSGGTLSIRSERGVGTVVRATWPLTRTTPTG